MGHVNGDGRWGREQWQRANGARVQRGTGMVGAEGRAMRKGGRGGEGHRSVVGAGRRHGDGYVDSWRTQPDRCGIEIAGAWLGAQVDVGVLGFVQVVAHGQRSNNQSVGR